MGGVNLYPGESGRFNGRGAHPEAPHDLFDLRNGERNGFTKLATRQADFDRGGRFRMGVDDFLCLAPGMTDLRPEVIAIAGSGCSPSRQRRMHCGIRLPINNHIARALKMVAINKDIAG